MIHQRNPNEEQARALAQLTELSEDEARSVTGGTDCSYAIYYDLETKKYIAVPSGQVFYQPGTILVC